MKSLLERLKEGPLLGDGAMGTQLQGAGLEPGGCGEAWNVTEPEKVLAIQRGYVEAGSDCLLTNTFGACDIMLERHDWGGRVADVNRAAAQIAREAFGGREGYVLGDIGPFGGLIEPLGDIPVEAVRVAFQEQARALVDGGVDAIIVETQTSLEELGLAIKAAKEAAAPCIIGSMAFDVTLDGSEARTMMGIDPECAAKFMVEAGVDVIALNCGSGIDMNWAARVVKRYRAACDLPVMAQPNSGTPTLENMQVVYKAGPEEMASGMPDVLQSGASIVGGCCGSTPAHIRRLRQVLDGYLESKS